MKGRKFFLKCIAAALPAILLIFYTICFPMCYMDEEYPAWRLKKEIASGKAYDGKSFDTVILGDSGAMSSIMPLLSEDSCVNLAAGGATSIEMYYFFSEYLKCHDAPKKAVIMFAPFHYWHIDNYTTRTVYFKALPLCDLAELYKNAKACKALSVYKEGFLKDEISARLGLPTKYLPALKAARFSGRLSDNEDSYAAVCAAYGYGPFGSLDACYDMSYETSYEDMTTDGDAKLVTLYMQKLLRLCNEYGIKVVLLQPAVNTATYENLNEHYIGSYKNYIKTISEVADDIEYETELRVYDGSFFSDTSHLNEKGAEKFTKEVLVCK